MEKVTGGKNRFITHIHTPYCHSTKSVASPFLMAYRKVQSGFAEA